MRVVNLNNNYLERDSDFVANPKLKNESINWLTRLVLYPCTQSLCYAKLS